MPVVAQNAPQSRLRFGPAGLRVVAAVAVLAALASPLRASAEIYGWVDASGTVTYSNLPPPKGAQLTDVIHEQPLSPQAVAESTHRAEVSALNDRIRLLELEMARSQREVVDYPAPPVAPAGVGCPPDLYSDCNGPWGSYYPGGVLYGVGGRYVRDFHGGNRGGYHPGNHLPPPSGRVMHVASSHSGGGHFSRR